MELEGKTLKEKAEWLYMVTENLDDAINEIHDYASEYPEIFKLAAEIFEKYWKVLDRQNKIDYRVLEDDIYENAIDELQALFYLLKDYWRLQLDTN